jgi:ppGpp synthetase/RelA/SpoT-type nucleotidyltranferase
LLGHAAARLENETIRQFEAVDRIDRINFRPKTPKSFFEKATKRRVDPPYAEPLLEVEDQVAGRVVVFFTSDIEPAVALVRQLFGAPVEVERKIPARDEEFGYESHHSVFDLPQWAHPEGWDARDDMPTMFELQIRTLFQHAYAEPQHDLAYKPDEPLVSRDKRELAWIAASAWGADQAYERVRARLTANS